MKKFVSFLLALVMLLSLAACGGPSEAAVACQDLIADIGEVTLDSGAAIAEAEEAFDDLEDEDQEKIAESAEKLEELREEYEELVAQAESQARVDEVAALIEAVGEVNTESEPAIVAAENAFAALSAEEQMMLGNGGAKLAELRAAFDTVVMQELAQGVISAIDAIGTVTMESKGAIEGAKAQYNALPADAKNLVTNYAVLEAAEAEYAVVVEKEKERIIKEYESNFEIDRDKVTGLTWYMHEDMPDYIDVRSYIIPYIGVDNGRAWVCIRYNYTEDDWVFWESMTIVTDNNKYYKYVGYWETTRDNDGGVVWEFYDECLNYNQDLDTEEFEMLKDIAESNETIIRFQGDEYHYDLYVSKKDKAIIKDVLALYGALIA